MISRLWTVTALGYAWLVAVLAIAVSQGLSAALMPRAWEFFWLVPVDSASPLAMAHVVGSAWLGLWRQRPFEAFSVTVLLLLLAYSVLWLVARLWAVGHRANIAKSAA